MEIEAERAGDSAASPGSMFRRFLKIGAFAWGGPAAQIEMLRQDFVERERWVDRETFGKTLAVYQVLPGPEATELCIYLGRRRGGRLAGVMAGLGFVIPGFLLMLAFSILYVEADLAASLDDLFYGLKAAVGALIARAVVRLSQNFLSDAALWALAIASFVLTLFAGVGFLLLLLGGGLAYELWARLGSGPGGAVEAAVVDLTPLEGGQPDNRGPEDGLRSIAPLPLLLAVSTGAITLGLTFEIAWEGLKAGLLTFGGAYTVIPFLQESSVEAQGWLTQSQFLDGLALGGVLPAPLIIFSTFVGYIAGGLVGSLAMTFAIFLPAFVLPTLFHRRLVAVSENPLARPFLLGVTAAVIGLIAAVGVEIIDDATVDIWTALLGLAAFAALIRWHSRLTVLGVVLGCGLLGAGLQLAGA